MHQLRGWHSRRVAGLVVMLKLLRRHVRRIYRIVIVHELPCGDSIGPGSNKLHGLPCWDLFSRGGQRLRELQCGDSPSEQRGGALLELRRRSVFGFRGGRLLVLSLGLVPS